MITLPIFLKNLFQVITKYSLNHFLYNIVSPNLFRNLQPEKTDVLLSIYKISESCALDVITPYIFRQKNLFKMYLLFIFWDILYTKGSLLNPNLLETFFWKLHNEMNTSIFLEIPSISKLCDLFKFCLILQILQMSLFHPIFCEQKTGLALCLDTWLHIWNDLFYFLQIISQLIPTFQISRYFTFFKYYFFVGFRFFVWKIF